MRSQPIAAAVGNSGGKWASVVAVMTIGNNNTLDVDTVVSNRGASSGGKWSKVTVLEATSGGFRRRMYSTKFTLG